MLERASRLATQVSNITLKNFSVRQIDKISNYQSIDIQQKGFIL